MFPNLRLMIVAIMASILGISCGLGVFAVFYINRDPILLLPSGAPPLLFSNAAPMAPNEPKSAEPFHTRFTVSLPPAPVAPTERPPAPDPTPSQVNSVMARTEPPESTNAEVTQAEVTMAVASTEATKAESTTVEAAGTEVTKSEGTTEVASTAATKAEATMADVASTDVTKAEATTAQAVVETSAGEQSPPSSVIGKKTVRPASAKIRAKTVRGKARAKTDSAKVRAKAARTRVTHTKLLRAHPDGVVQFADQTFAAQPVYQYSQAEPATAVRIRRTGRHRMR